MNVLVTGGAGYIGYGVVRRLAKAVGETGRLVIYDNLSRKSLGLFTQAEFPAPRVQFIRGDLLDGRTLAKALDGIDVVIHLAARVSTPNDDRDAHAFDQVNHWGCAQLALAVSRSPVRRVIHLSSIAVYGFTPEPCNESSPTHPFSFYGRSKLDGEHQLESLPSGIELIVLRAGNVYGYNPAFRTDAVINQFMFNANFGRKIQINGSGNQQRSFIHVDALAEVIAAAVDGQVPAGVYNAAQHSTSILEVAHTIGRVYPDLELVHSNYDSPLRDIVVELPGKLGGVLDLPESQLQRELQAFRERFAF
jgi:UDP-glucose 4-epimerase